MKVGGIHRLITDTVLRIMGPYFPSRRNALQKQISNVRLDFSPGPAFHNVPL